MKQSSENKINLTEVKWLLKNPDFNQMPCQSFTEFVDNPYYLGVGKDIYRKIKIEGDIIVKGILDGKYTEGIMLCGIGSGKSLTAEILSAWMIHYLLCLKNPHEHFHLANDKPIVVINMGTTAHQAKNVIFAGIRKLVENSPFFAQHNPEVLQTEIKFTKKNLAMYCGNSNETMPIGMNVFMGCLDEAAWYLDNDNKCTAEDIYNTMKDRIVSRFGLKGFMFTISAPRYVEDFITRHYEKSKQFDFIYASSYKTWELKDREKMSPDTFKFKVDETEEWEVPMDFYGVAQANPEKFLRDFGARPALVLEAFDRDSDIINRKINKSRTNPIDDRGAIINSFTNKTPEGMIIDREPRYIHIDLAYKKDACGLAMGKLNGFDTSNGDRKPKVWIDLMMQMKPKPDQEIMFEEVRQIIYGLRDRGFNIKKVTYDGFQSVDSIQILKSRGIQAETLSMDRTTEGYDTMKELIHTDRMDYYEFPAFLKEYRTLEMVKGKKVDHPPGGSKDVADAVAGVCYSIVKEMGGKKGGHFGFLEEMAKEGVPQQGMSTLEQLWRQSKGGNSIQL